MALQYTAAGIASTLMAMTPIIILLPSYWLFHTKITWRAVLGAVISVIGVSLFFLAKLGFSYLVWILSTPRNLYLSISRSIAPYTPFSEGDSYYLVKFT